MTNYYANAQASRAMALANQKTDEVRQLSEYYEEAVNAHDRMVDKCDYLANQLKNWKEFAGFNADANRKASEGNTVAGYTNNLAQELGILKFDLMHEFWEGSHPNTKLALPSGALPERYETFTKMTIAHRKYINLRMLCRSEWFDWCQHIEVLGLAQQAIVKAFLKPTKDNEVLRNREYIEDLNSEMDKYTSLREKAKDHKFGVQVRENFENERMKFWKDKIRYEIDKNDRNCPVPKTDLTKKANPSIRFDSYLPAGRLTAKWKIDITTGKPASSFRDSNAGGLESGQSDLIAGSFYL